MIVEPATPTAGAVAAAVRAEWGVDVTAVEHVSVGAGAWHWSLGDDEGPRWFATVDTVRTAEERQRLLATYEAAATLAARLPFVVAPVRTRDARVAVDVAPGRLLTLTPYLEGATGDGSFADDRLRTGVARMLGELHLERRPRTLPVWRPTIGWHPHAGREQLEECLSRAEWDGGPWSVPAARMLADCGSVVRQAMRRFALLGAAVAGSVDRWVVTHGEPHSGNLVDTPDGLRLVDWATLRLAPRERDLREVLGAAEGTGPWFAYVESGGRPDPFSPDALELFALEWHLSEIAENAVLFSGPHEDTPDARRSFGDLEAETAALVERWG